MNTMISGRSSIQRLVQQQQHLPVTVMGGISRIHNTTTTTRTNVVRYGTKTKKILQSASSFLSSYQQRATTLNTARRSMQQLTNITSTITTTNTIIQNAYSIKSSLSIFTTACARYYTVPIVVESGSLGERAFDIYSRLLRERIICVHGQIDDPLASVVTAQLLFLEAEQPNRPVYMYINSPGGLVTAGMAIYDTMQYITPDVHTICMGQAASMGSLLLAGGCHGHRYALPNARIMVHQPSGGAQGMASDIDIQAKEILRTRQRLNTLYVHHTGQSFDRIETVMDRDTFFDPTEAKNFGIIDSILTKRDDNSDDDPVNTSTSSSTSDTATTTTTTTK